MEDKMRKMAANFAAFNPSYAPEHGDDQSPSRSGTKSRAGSIQETDASQFDGPSGVAIAWVAFYAIAIVIGLLKAGGIG